MPDGQSKSGGAPSSSEARLDQLAAEFVAEHRAGRSPAIEAYAQSNPDLAERIRELFPTLLTLERVVAQRAPERLGDYSVLRVVAHGGMGVVYEAIQEGVGRRVALKTLPVGAAADPKYLERFRRETRAVAALSHPNIVQLFEAGLDGGEHFYAMEFVDGIGLDQLIVQSRSWRRGELAEPHELVVRAWTTPLGETSKDLERSSAPSHRLWLRNVVAIVRQVAEALAYSHGRGILHRDVKPSNILLGLDGRARLTDFGLAKSEGSQDLTVTGDVVGTLRYMPPERFQGRSDPRGDTYSLGLVLYELATLTSAFDGISKSQLLGGRIGLELPRARGANPDIPADLETIIGKASASALERRYASAEDFAQDLSAFLEGRAITARDPSTWYLLRVAVRRNKLASAIGAAAAALLLAGAAKYVLDVRRERDEAELARDRASSESYAACIASAADALERGDVARAQLALEAVDAQHRGWEFDFLAARVERASWTSPRRESHYEALAFDATGERLLAILDKRLECWNLAKRALEFEFEVQDDQCSNIALHPDGRTLAVACERRRVVKLVDLVERRVTRDLEGHTDQVKDVVYLADGSRLVSAAWDGTAIVWDAATAEPLRTLSHGGQWLHDLDVDPQQRWLALGGGRCVALFDAHDFRPLGQFAFEDGDVRKVGFCVEGPSLVVAFHSGEHRMLSVPALGELARWRDVERLGNALACDPLGEFVASGSNDGRLALRRIGVETLPQLLGGHTGELNAACFSSDGLRLYTSAWDGCIREWLVPRVDTETLTGHFAVVSDLDMDARGERLVSSAEDGTLRVWDLASREPLAVHLPADGAGRLDLDAAGERVAVASGVSVLVFDLEGLRPIARLRSLEGANDVALSALGSVAAVGPAGDLQVWSGADYSFEERQNTRRRDLAAVAFDPAGEHLASSDASGEICVWALGPLELERRIPAHGESACHALDWAESGTLISGGDDLRLCRWAAANGDLLREVDTGRNQSNRLSTTIYKLRHLPALERVVTISTGAVARLWDLRAGRQMLALDLGAGCWAQAATPDGSLLAFGLVDGRIRLFERQPKPGETLRRALAVRAERQRFRQRVDELFADGADPEFVLAQLEADGALNADEREAALAVARTWLGEPHNQLTWVEARLRGALLSLEQQRQIERIVLSLARRCRSCFGVTEAHWRSLRAVAAHRTAQAQPEGDFARVAQLFGEAQALAQRGGAQLPPWHSALYASALVHTGDLDAAQRLLEQLSARGAELDARDLELGEQARRELANARSSGGGDGR